MAWGQEMEWAGEWGQVSVPTLMVMWPAGPMGPVVDREIAGAMEPAAKTITTDPMQIASKTERAVREQIAGKEQLAWITENAAAEDIVGAVRLMKICSHYPTSPDQKASLSPGQVLHNSLLPFLFHRALGGVINFPASKLGLGMKSNLTLFPLGLLLPRSPFSPSAPESPS